MDWKQFFAAIISAAAWPIAAVVIVHILKTPLSKIHNRVRSLKMVGVDVDLSQQLDNLTTAVAADSSDQAAPTPTAPQPGVMELARLDPRSAVLSAWLEVEKETRDLAAKVGIPVDDKKPIIVVANQLHGSEMMDQLVFSTFRKLRKIRNEAAHLTEVDVSFEEAISMANLCQWLAARLKYENFHFNSSVSKAGTN